MDTKAHKKTERAQKKQFFDTKANKKTEKAQKRRKQSISTSDESLLTPRLTRRQKEHRRDRNKANQLKANQLEMRVF